MNADLINKLKAKFKPITDCILCGNQINRSITGGHWSVTCKHKVCKKVWSQLDREIKEYFKTYYYHVKDLHEIDSTDAEYKPEILLDGTLIDEHYRMLAPDEEPEDQIWIDAFEKYTEKRHESWYNHWDHKQIDHDVWYLIDQVEFKRPPDMEPIINRFQEISALEKLKEQIDRMSRGDYNASVLDAKRIKRCNPCIYKFINSNQIIR